MTLDDIKTSSSVAVNNIPPAVERRQPPLILYYREASGLRAAKLPYVLPSAERRRQGRNRHWLEKVSTIAIVLENS
jgi:hypothetical protein